ncbi:MAG: hypothetical protein HYV04_08280 [Deltaproteobacteria bacterium]|nr:hypothetical protein [Deltaproteobacteria bacterium]
MANQAEIEQYNYSVFAGSEEFTAFRTHLPVGSSALDFQATLLDSGQPVKLSEYWKKEVVKFLVEIFLSDLEPMASKFAPKGVQFVFLYTHEAHPGENYPAHRSFEQKLAHARAFKERLKIERPILVDDLVGTAHKLYGSLPNMTYLIGRGGKVMFRADWTDPPTIEYALNYVLNSRARRREGLRLAPFYAEFVGYRWNDPAKFQEGLARAGQQAVDDFARVMQRWQKQGLRPGRIELNE